jgi:hypothetical protein
MNEDGFLPLMILNKFWSVENDLSVEQLIDGVHGSTFKTIPIKEYI